jgi:hypothetical protein
MNGLTEACRVHGETSIIPKGVGGTWNSRLYGRLPLRLVISLRIERPPCLFKNVGL